MKLSENLIALIKEGMEEALDAGNPDPSAMVLATASKTGKVSSRTLLLKGLDADGLRFFTNLNSRKGHDLLENPQASMTFYWPEVARQIQVEGAVVQISAAQADQYFASRPRGSQIGAWASLQSEPLRSRELFEQRISQITQKYSGQDIPRPPHWSGFVLQAERLEFWHGRAYRLHERQVFIAGKSGWEEQLLYP